MQLDSTVIKFLMTRLSLTNNGQSWKRLSWNSRILKEKHFLKIYQDTKRTSWDLSCLLKRRYKMEMDNWNHSHKLKIHFLLTKFVKKLKYCSKRTDFIFIIPKGVTWLKRMMKSKGWSLTAYWCKSVISSLVILNQYIKQKVRGKLLLIKCNNFFQDVSVIWLNRSMLLQMDLRMRYPKK